MREWCREHKRLVKWMAALAFLAVTGWAVWYFWPDPQLAEARELRAQLTGENGRSLTPEKRRELWGQLRHTMDQLSPEQRRTLGAEQRKARQQQLADYFKLSPEERKAYLDRQIDRMEALRREMNPMRAQNGNAPFAGQRPRTPEERDRLDATTPDERAQRAEFFRDLQTRRQERGLGGSPLRGGRG
jgi:hypothetical protein